MKSFKCTILCVGLIFYLCLFTPPKTQLDSISQIDKIFHFIMYLGTMGVFWAEYWWTREKTGFRLRRPLLLLISLLAPILMSGGIELLQAYCTGGRRSGEWVDFLANSLGVLAAYPLGNTWIKYWVSRISRR